MLKALILIHSIHNSQNIPLYSHSRPPVDQCEVTSSVGPYLPAMEVPTSSNWTPKPIPWEIPKPYPEPGDIWTNDGPWGSGVIVDPIKTYHMGVALATKQTPFALLKPDNGAPVLVKVVDTALPGGKQVNWININCYFCSNAC